MSTEVIEISLILIFAGGMALMGLVANTAAASGME